MRFLAPVLAWALAAICAAALGSIVQTQSTLASLLRLGVPVDMATRASATIHDLLSFAPLYLVLVAAAFAVALPTAALAARALRGPRPAWFFLAGAAAVAAMLWIMDRSLPVTAISAARTASGALALVLAGGIGGLVHALVHRPAGPRPV